jgi:multisubunit Na+/H+ antiporter MnhB subunit
MMIEPLCVFAIICMGLVLFIIMVSNKRFEQRFFRVDSDNVTWVFGAVLLFLLGVGSLLMVDFSMLLTRTSSYITGYFIAVLLFFVGSYGCWRKGSRTAAQKPKEKKEVKAT